MEPHVRKLLDMKVSEMHALASANLEIGITHGGVLVTMVDFTNKMVGTVPLDQVDPNSGVTLTPTRHMSFFTFLAEHPPVQLTVQLTE